MLLSCQGPWSYFPENPENYQGIWISAFVISERPVENVCFDKMHALNEARMPRFAFYDSASVKIRARTQDTTFILEPQQSYSNCFTGPNDLLAKAGETYELDATIHWDSAGHKVTSNFQAETTIPEKFKVKKAYDTMGKQYGKGDSVLYFPSPMDMKAHYFIPEYSDDVAGVLVSMIFGNDVYWAENLITQLASQFTQDYDSTTVSAFLAEFGDRDQVFFARNMKLAGSQNEVDSIPVIGMAMPAKGTFKLLFYATTSDYVKYRDSYLNGADDSRVQGVYNIKGGAGIFAGMLVDTFTVHIEPDSKVKIHSYSDAQINYCYREDSDTHLEEWRASRRCIEIWDSEIWRNIYCGEFEKDGWKCSMLGSYENGKLVVTGYKLEKEEYEDIVTQFPKSLDWKDIPVNKIRELLNEEELIAWCSYRHFPIEYEPCGSAMVLFSKGKNSVVLEREVKDWCSKNEWDKACEK